MKVCFNRWIPYAVITKSIGEHSVLRFSQGGFNAEIFHRKKKMQIPHREWRARKHTTMRDDVTMNRGRFKQYRHTR